MAGPRRKSGAKIVTKREQTELFEHLDRLAEDPSPLMPETGGNTFRAVAKLERRLRQLAAVSEKPGRLKLGIRFGSAFSKAFANLLLVRNSRKAGRMGSFRSPVGDLKYAVRGNVSPRHIVAIQHYRYPEVRILGYRELAQETKGVVWSTEHGVTLTARGQDAPDAWFDLLAERLPTNLERDGTTLRCEHMVGVVNLHAPTAPYGMHVAITAGNVHANICEACIHNHFSGRTHGLLGHAGRLLIGVDIERDITVEPTGTPHSCTHEGDCAWSRHPPTISAKALERYRSGADNEGALLAHVLPRWEDAVREADEPVLVAGGICHGDDRQAFLAALSVTPEMAEAVSRFLDASPRALIVGEPSVNKVLDACWDAAPRVLASLHPNPEDLDALLERHRRSPHSAVLEEVLEARQAKTALAGFPTYGNLSGGAAAADHLARGYKVGGAPRLLAVADRELKRSTHKGVVYAALRVVEGTQGREWHFQRTDVEAGEFLEDAVRALLASKPDSYHDALASVHTLSGGVGDLPAGRA